MGVDPAQLRHLTIIFIINIIIFLFSFFFRNAAEMKALEQCAVFAVVQQFIDKDKLKFEH